MLWAATISDGLYAHTGGSWRRLAGSDRLGSAWLYSLRPSPRGGVWIAGAAGAVRALPRPDSDEGFAIVERLGRLHGLVNGSVNDVLEQADGTLWVATFRGIARIPAHVRARKLPPPRVVLTSRRLNGTVRGAEQLSLPYQPGVLELQFAALSFVDPRAVRYRVQLGRDRAWSAPFEQPALQLVDLPPGSYDIRVAASVDGVTWSPARETVRVRVARPWFQRLWFWALVLAGVVLLVFAVQRARMAVRLRLARQRLRIAMDLHDEMGSSLGSIGLLADVVSQPQVPEAKKAELAREIAGTASQLGTSLRDIVWTLREDSDSLDALIVQLSDRAASLFPAERPRFVTELPEHGTGVTLSLPVRRNLQLLAQEALHNAARHANADTVTLGLRPVDAGWILWVEDDGIGCPKDDSGKGLGLTSMRRRAADIGARLTIGPASDGKGTRVQVQFAPRAQDRRVLRASSGSDHRRTT